MDFYTDLYSTSEFDSSSAEEMLWDLPRLETAQADSINLDNEIQEVTTVVHQLSASRSPGIHGLPAEFYKQSWGLREQVLLDVFKASFNFGVLPTSCTRAVLTLHPIKGDLGL